MLDRCPQKPEHTPFPVYRHSILQCFYKASLLIGSIEHICHWRAKSLQSFDIQFFSLESLKTGNNLSVLLSLTNEASSAKTKLSLIFSVPFLYLSSSLLVSVLKHGGVQIC